MKATAVPENDEHAAQLPQFIDIQNYQSIIDYSSSINDAVRDFVYAEKALFVRNGCISAYVTLCTPHYYFGLIGLVRSLRMVSSLPLICLIDSEFDASAIDGENVFFIKVPRLISSKYNPGRKEFSEVLTKLWIFGITSLDKIVFLDCDVCILKNVDDLFDFQGPAFAPDYVDHLHTQRFNSGVCVIEPCTDEFRRLVGFSRNAASYDGGDQGILNNYFCGNHNWLPQIYNTLKHAVYYQGNATIDIADIRIIHYIVKKPWEIKYRESCDTFLVPVEDEWTRRLSKNDLLTLIRHWRKEIFILYEREKLQSGESRRREVKRQRQTIWIVILLLFINVAAIGPAVLYLALR
jgi:hypothetical protein